MACCLGFTHLMDRWEFTEFIEKYAVCITFKGYLKMTNKKSIVVVGGGTAGWITLSYLSAVLDADFTIIHSNEIDIIGVGESTTPTVNHVAQAVGVNEAQWMRDSRATFKYGVDFYNFKHQGHRWFHSFDDLLPAQTFHRPLAHNGKQTLKKNLTSAEYFLHLRKQDPEKYNMGWYNHHHGPVQYCLDNELSPFAQDGEPTIGDYPGYAYHINAFEFGQSLRNHTPADKFTEIVDTVVDVEYADHGIRSLQLKSGRTITGDIFFDCTGFRRLLIGKLSSYKKYAGLQNNAAIFGSVSGIDTVKPATEAHAQAAGWIWQIPTVGRVGSGHVYSNDFMTEQQAIDTMCDFWQRRGGRFELQNSAKFDGGKLEHMSIGNVVSNGLAQSFIEPLEATSVMITCSTVIEFARIFQRHQDWNERTAKMHNRQMSRFLERTKDFVLYHYELSDRNDNEYWNSYKRSDTQERLSDQVRSFLNDIPWAEPGQTLMNGFNWVSMLTGFNAPYLHVLPQLTNAELERYLIYSDAVRGHSQALVKNNKTIRQFLNEINQ